MGPISSHDYRPGSEQNLLAFYELVPSAEEEDLVDEQHRERRSAWAAQQLASFSRVDDVLLDPEPDYRDEPDDDDDVEPLTPLQLLGMIEHVLGAEEIDEA